MKIGILTSSRADFGIYMPLLKRLYSDKFFKPKLIVFGTHLSPFHGNSIPQIILDGFDIDYKVESLILGDSVEANSTATALTYLKFSSFWGEHHNEFDLVFCLGDRFEMFAAVMSAVPFQIKFAHIHGGEKTLGAIDNIFRHSISLASWVHFTAAEQFSDRLKMLLEDDQRVYTVGALGLDNLNNIKLLNFNDFLLKWKLKISRKYILVTFHPETVSYNSNEEFTKELIDALIILSRKFDLIITMPNVDQFGSYIRLEFQKRLSNLDGVNFIENFGTQSYFTAMKYSAFLIGNTSSGIIEAASLNKMVINLGDRQKGRLHGENVINTSISKKKIIEAVNSILEMKEFHFDNPYGKGEAASKIIEILKKLDDSL
jgi:GDP/UDP-N,N'-diacetylbacillosamine 2-epimerase (hydrolysing)